MSPICLTCKSSKATPFSKNDKTIPLWMKLQGNYSLIPPILQGDKYNANKTSLKKSIPNITNIKVKIPLNLGKTKKLTWVFYWSSKEYDDYFNPKKNPPAAEAYSDYKNSGLLKTNAEGKVTLELSCPTPYKVENITYPAHVHFTILKSDKTWSEDVYTSDVLCLLNIRQMRDISLEKSHVIINSLDHEYYAKSHIPNSYNLQYNELSKMKKTEQTIKIDNFMRYHVKKYPKLLKLYESKKIKLKELPIVIYCYSKTCNSATNLVKTLLKHGYSNVLEFTGGIVEWEKHHLSDSKPFSKSKSHSKSENISPRKTRSKTKSPTNTSHTKSPRKALLRKRTTNTLSSINNSINIIKRKKEEANTFMDNIFRFPK